MESATGRMGITCEMWFPSSQLGRGLSPAPLTTSLDSVHTSAALVSALSVTVNPSGAHDEVILLATLEWLELSITHE